MDTSRATPSLGGLVRAPKNDPRGVFILVLVIKIITGAGIIQIFISTRRTSAPELPEICQCVENDFYPAPAQSRQCLTITIMFLI